MIQENKAVPEETRVPIDLGERSYDIHISRGSLPEVGPLLNELFPDAHFAIITDENVANLHLDTLTESLTRQSLTHDVFPVEPGEASKSFPIFEDLCERMLAGRFERGDVIVALGGGVVGDLSGFVAGVVRRGMNFVQIPTTLLAQVDSSVGGKTGINTRFGKNLLGVFLQPGLVLADTALLDTLPKRDFRAGYAEVVKYGLINDAEFFSWLENNWQAIFSGGRERDEAVAHACRAKAAIVATDEREAGERALLNLGHTFGHALEAATGYDADLLVHGEGVSIGMCLAHAFSEKLGLCPSVDVQRITAHLSEVGLPTRLDQMPGQLPPAETLMDHIAQDKKVSRGNLTFILTRGIGQSFIETNVDPGKVLSFIEEKLS